MINLDFFVKAMKSTWIKRLVLSQDSPWATLFQNQCCPIKTLLDSSPIGVYTTVSKAKKQFWNEVFETWDFIYNAIPILSINTLLSPLGRKPRVRRRLYKETWYKNGITLVGDLVSNSTGGVMSIFEIENMYNFKIKNFLDYFEVTDAVKKKHRGTRS